MYQVLAVLGAIALIMAIDIPMFRGAQATGSIRWGRIAPRSQYVLILLAVHVGAVDDRLRCATRREKASP